MRWLWLVKAGLTLWASHRPRSVRRGDDHASACAATSSAAMIFRIVRKRSASGCLVRPVGGMGRKLPDRLTLEGRLICVVTLVDVCPETRRLKPDR